MKKQTRSLLYISRVRKYAKFGIFYTKIVQMTPLRLQRESLRLQKFSVTNNTGKNIRLPFLDILGYLKNSHKNPKLGKVRQVPTREFPTKFPEWDMSHSSKFGIFVGINFFKYPKIP